MSTFSQNMDTPVLRLLLLPENWNLLWYFSCMLLHCGISLAACEPEAPINLVQEPEPDTIKASESTHANQSSPKLGANLDLIDLWFVDPVPTQVPTIDSSSSLLVPSGYMDDTFLSGDLLLPVFLPDSLVPSPLVIASPLDHSSSSSALPPPLPPWGSSASPLASDKLVHLVITWASRHVSPPWPVCPSALPWFCIP